MCVCNNSNQRKRNHPFEREFGGNMGAFEGRKGKENKKKRKEREKEKKGKERKK